MKPPKAIAFYLPQYHPIPENHLWWGKALLNGAMLSMRESVLQAITSPICHRIWDFMILRLPEAREAQAKLASQFGIHGFCYYHY